MTSEKGKSNSERPSRRHAKEKVGKSAKSFSVVKEPRSSRELEENGKSDDSEDNSGGKRCDESASGSDEKRYESSDGNDAGRHADNESEDEHEKSGDSEDNAHRGVYSEGNREKQGQGNYSDDENEEISESIREFRRQRHQQICEQLERQQQRNLDRSSSQGRLAKHPPNRHIKKCKSATFSLDGMLYTIGEYTFCCVLVLWSSFNISVSLWSSFGHLCSSQRLFISSRPHCLVFML